ncbi:MAG: thioredoxin domain-containing protein [Deltaproteobacteria bacterium]|nr:thioredoxin domain-containing protein [Deltaproteobacteria bacterium]
MPPNTLAAVRAALGALPKGFAPRTRHHGGREHKGHGEHPDPMAPAGSNPNYVNRLILEHSPYLRQHAFNPVDWRPWGEEAFAEARTLNRPIFLSIGYATCHWCHVMEHESFEDLEVAAALNSLYVPVKVDREERPDVDAVYMAAVQAMTGRGGWPMSVWLAADPSTTTGVHGLPFFAGTYFPARDGDRGTRSGFLTLLRHFAQAWQRSPAEVVAEGRKVAAHIAAELTQTGAGERTPTVADVDGAVRVAAHTYDEANGGRRGAPKFPSQVPLGLLCRHWLRTGDGASLRMARHTLDKMASGGLYDHVGGGFHRYSTDARWFAPHFEKMLYDQALIVQGALEVWQATGDAFVRRAIVQTLDYLLREMQDAQGGFYSATDADSEGREGLYFLWTIDQLRQVLGKERGDRVASVYGATARGNFEGSNILHLDRTLAASAAALDMSEAALSAELDVSLAQLLAARSKRVPPLLDHKVMPAWNGLALSALARAALVLGEPRFAVAARRAADFLWSSMQERGRLKRSWVHGTARGTGFLDDYAHVVQGCLDLYEATGDRELLARAMQLQVAQDAHFWDAAAGGYFATPDDGQALLARAKPDRDGAEPAGNSVTANNLLRLAAMTGGDSWRRKAMATWLSVADRLAQYPILLTEMLLSVESAAWPMREVVLVRPAGAPLAAAEPMLAVLRSHYMPHRVLLHAEMGPPLDELAGLAPVVSGKVARDGKVTAYVCRHGVCELPTTDPAVFAGQLMAGVDPSARRSSP